MQESEFLKEYPLALEEVEFFIPPVLSKATAPRLNLATPDAYQIKVKDFHTELVQVNRLYFYVKPEGDDPLEWKAAFIVAKAVKTKAMYVATEVFTLKDFNEVYQRSEAVKVEYNSDFDKLFKRKAKAYSKAKLKPFDPQEIFEILSGGISLAELNAQKPLNSFSYKDSSDKKYLIECFNNYANVWSAHGSKVHFVQFFKNKAQRKHWIEKHSPDKNAADIEFYSSELQGIDELLAHIKKEEASYPLRFGLLSYDKGFAKCIESDDERRHFLQSEFEIIEGDWIVDGDLIIERDTSLWLKGNLEVKGSLLFRSLESISYNESYWLENHR